MGRSQLCGYLQNLTEGLTSVQTRPIRYGNIETVAQGAFTSKSSIKPSFSPNVLPCDLITSSTRLTPISFKWILNTQHNGPYVSIAKFKYLERQLLRYVKYSKSSEFRATLYVLMSFRNQYRAGEFEDIIRWWGLNKRK